MNIKAAYKRFKQWQLDPFEYKSKSQELQHCNNCGNDYVGNYCPICSQKNDVGRITWKSVLSNIALLWGMHNRSLLYSILQLFLRPGYFISDYISGKQQISFPPVKMLALTALLGVLVDVLTGNAVGMFRSEFYEFNGDKLLFLDNAVEWMNTHPDLISMIMLSYLIIPNYYIFRFAPRNTYHTLPQGFFIQVFSSVAFLIINMIYDITSLGGLAFFLSVLFLFFTYKQLFGYGIWGTLWRLIATFTAGFVLASIMLWLDFSIHLFIAGLLDIAAGIVLFEIVSIIVFILILWISYKISKARRPKNKAGQEPSEVKNESSDAEPESSDVELESSEDDPESSNTEL